MVEEDEIRSTVLKWVGEGLRRKRKEKEFEIWKGRGDI